MNTRQFFAPTHREAMKRLRAELGNEAMILSSRNIDGGVEVVALLDYDDIDTASKPKTVAADVSPSSPAPTLETGAPDSTQAMMASLLSEMQSMKAVLSSTEPSARVGRTAKAVISPEDTFVRAGIQHGLSETLCRTLWQQTANQAFESVDARLEDGLSQLLSVSEHDEWLTRGGIFALVGPTGVGKTTTVAKLAARFSMRGSKESIALITTDTHRVGGREQLLTYGKLFGVEAYAARSREELAEMVGRLSNKRLILIDTVGVGQRDERVSEQLAMLPLNDQRLRPVLVLDSTRHGDTLDDVAQIYHKAITELLGGRVADCILSKTDEALHISSAIDVAARHHLNVLCLTNGQNITEHLTWQRAQGLAKLVMTPRPETAFSMPSELFQAQVGATEVSVPDQWAGQVLREGRRLNACVHYLRDEVGGFRTLERLWGSRDGAQALTDPGQQIGALKHSEAGFGRLDVFWQKKANGSAKPALLFSEFDALPVATFLPVKGLPVSMIGRAVWLSEQVPEAALRHHFTQLPDHTTREALAQFGVSWRAMVRGNMKIEHGGERMTMAALANEMLFDDAGMVLHKDRELRLQLGWLDAAVEEGGVDQSVRFVAARLVDPVTQERVTSRYGLDQGLLDQRNYLEDMALWISRTLTVEAHGPLSRRAENELASEAFASDALVRAFAAAQASMVAWRLKHDRSDNGRIMRDQVLKMTRTGRQPSANAMLKATLKLCAMVNALGQCALAEAG
ncbi:flagellar biosynthesis protein FlhF [Larsenimonas salina]|uniref:flagellar biosynthesis protein FlhF n=1 Tax=Larsenimonas salina TaxID=1295565 RepID=UPI002072AE37|nr:flagellar biosynthesis protein FlhF [Larsenimonas salina]MCM5703737.1 flagellar biosynthesis protein FlhF [Larsenimonas salina]